MTGTTLDVSVVICAYTEERWGDLVAAVESLQQQSSPPREVILVVDYNTRLLERARMHLHNVLVIENKEPQGLSGARNSGIALAKGALIAFLDDDATAEKDWLARLIHCCKNIQVLGAGGTVKPHWLSPPPSWFPKEFNWVVGCSYQDVPDEPIVVRNPYGGCSCMRREIFAVVGGFRSEIGRVGTLPLGCEETDLCIRAKHHWLEKVFLYEPQAIIYHRIPPHRATWRYFRSRCYAEGLSKAVVAAYVGTKDGLASERPYVLRTLPRGVFHSLGDGLFRLDPGGFLRAGAIIAGLMITIAGYIVGAASHRLALRKEISTNRGSQQIAYPAEKTGL